MKKYSVKQNKYELGYKYSKSEVQCSVCGRPVEEGLSVRKCSQHGTAPWEGDVNVNMFTEPLAKGYKNW